MKVKFAKSLSLLFFIILSNDFRSTICMQSDIKHHPTHLSGTWPQLSWLTQAQNGQSNQSHWPLNPEFLTSSFQDLISTNGCQASTDDPDTLRNVSEIIVSRGYLAEEHDVVTPDGYILIVQRIINPLAKGRKLRPMILQHGLLSSSVDWVINSEDVKPARWSATNHTYTSYRDDNDETQEQPNSLGFYLANQGYDVYLANSRGNFYGQRHIKMSSNESKFWDFCFDEKIIYDLPATIKYVQQLTNSQKIGYVGHSQGAAMMFGLMADQPDYADLIEPFIAFGPVAYVNNAITPFRRFDFLTPFLQRRNAPFTVSKALVSFLASYICNREVLQKEICANVLFLMVGFNEAEFDSKRLPAYLCHMPSGTSVRNMAHYGQETRSGRFAHFDFGLDDNISKYGRQLPPDYNLANIRSKSMAFFTAENDWLASPKDVAHLISSLKTKPYALINMTEIMPLWNHIDFIYGKSAGKLVNTRVHRILQEFENQPIASL